MADIVDKATRSRMMSGIRGKDTKPELAVRRFLHARGFRYRIAPSSLPGRPDLYLPKYKTAIFVHGCFWHRHPGCRFATTPRTNEAFWSEKFSRNVQRDKQVQEDIASYGLKSIILWECEINQNRLDALADQISGTAND